MVARLQRSWANSMKELRKRLEALTDSTEYTSEARVLFDHFKEALNCGEVRAAERDETGRWHANVWVKRAILLGFRMGSLTEMSSPGSEWRFFEKDTYPRREFRLSDNVRIVPGGSSIRDGAYLGPRVVCMPPMLRYYEWLQERVAKNYPMDKIVQELLSAKGGTFANAATNYYQIERDTLKTAENVAQVFMGMRTQ